MAVIKKAHSPSTAHVSSLLFICALPLNHKLFQVRMDYAAMLWQCGKKDEALHA